LVTLKYLLSRKRLLPLTRGASGQE
jgi:hypothetical protein